MTGNGKTHYRKAFDSPYLSSADIVEPTALTVARVTLEADRTKKTKEKFNTAWFVEKELRPGEKLKPMILNATNSKTMKTLTGSAFIEDWENVRITVYVDPGVRFGKDTVEGLRISPDAIDPSWHDGIRESGSVDELKAVKAEMVTAFGSPSSIPRELIRAYNAKWAEVNA